MTKQEEHDDFMGELLFVGLLVIIFFGLGFLAGRFLPDQSYTYKKAYIVDKKINISKSEEFQPTIYTQDTSFLVSKSIYNSVNVCGEYVVVLSESGSVIVVRPLVP
jgi:hypothetical protein